jgi:hypothetical protein
VRLSAALSERAINVFLADDNLIVVAEGNRLADAISAVATGATALDPAIVEALVRSASRPASWLPPGRNCSA